MPAQPKGDLAKAFLIVTPLLLVGGLVVLRGRRYVTADIAAATVANDAAETAADRPTGGGSPPGGA